MTATVPEQRRDDEPPAAYVARIFRTCSTCDRADFPTAAAAIEHQATCGWLTSWPASDPDTPAPAGWFTPTTTEST